MVALTQTISDFFGAKVVDRRAPGIILNNEMKNFSARGPNAMAPGKRMRTTIAPTIVLRDGRAFATLGTPGAARIISTMTLLVSNLVDYGMGIQEAIEAPRFYAATTPTKATCRRRGAGARRDGEALTKLGYTREDAGRLRPVLRRGAGDRDRPEDRRGAIGGADPRRDGAVVGY